MVKNASNSSLHFDEVLILKIYSLLLRGLYIQRRPDGNDFRDDQFSAKASLDSHINIVH